MILDVGQNCDLKPTHRNHIQNRIKTISKLYQHRMKTISKLYQNHIKTTKTLEIDQKGCPAAVSVSFLEANPSETLKKALRSPTTQSIYIKNITKPYRNHKPKFKAYQLIFQSYQKLF